MATIDHNNGNNYYNSHFPMQNHNFSHDFIMTSNNNNNNINYNNTNTNTNTNLCPLPPQIIDFRHVFSNNNLQQQNNFAQNVGNGYNNNVVQEMGSFTTNANINTNNNNADNSLMNSIISTQQISSLLDKHRNEIDLYLHFQGEKLKEALQQQKKQQMGLVINKCRTSTMALMKEREQELKMLREKTKMLEGHLNKKEEEIQAWKRIASEKEQMVNELKNMYAMIKQNICNLVAENDGRNINKGNDAESVCECEVMSNARGNNQGIYDGNEMKNYWCRWCNCKGLSVVFLPCRHLSCCKQCEPILDYCLVCQSPKQASVEILL